jgi:hypothetical protein
MPAASQQAEALGFERTPPRLGFSEGDVAFLRAGAADWTSAQVNTPLAPGDELYTDAASNLEIQAGPRAYVRAGERTQLGLATLEPDYLQLRVTSGSVSLDLRSLTASQTFELATPNAAFTIERTGYYRVDVEGDTTSFTTRRGGRATVTPAAGAPVTIEPSEQVVVRGAAEPTLVSYAAPELDEWDRWNYERTDDLLDAVSARYVSPGVYGVADLDHHGDWRIVPTYGAVWVPRALPTGWVPYSTGRWIYDPYYAWTWVDAMPWGWAPYHYGRWVFVSGHWAWCPGPVVVRPYYAPALVAFFGGGGFTLGVTLGTPYLGWVALGWGEPLIPWWGPVGFRGRPHWARWAGPRFVNRVRIERTRVVRAPEIHSYEHARERHRIVAVERERFGRRERDPERFRRGDVARLDLVRGELPVKPDRTSLVPSRDRARAPTREVVDRPVVATRRPPTRELPKLERRTREPEPVAPPQARVRVVEPPREGRRIVAPERPPFARDGAREREMPAPAPRFEELRRRWEEPAPSAGTAPIPAPPVTSVPRTETRTQPRTETRTQPRVETRTQPRPETRTQPRIETRTQPRAETRTQPRAETRTQPRAETRTQPRVEPRRLPGEPANRVWRDRPSWRPRSGPGGEARSSPRGRSEGRSSEDAPSGSGAGGRGRPGR